MELEELNNLLNQATSQPKGLIGQVCLPDKKKPGVFSDIKIRLLWILGIFTVTSVIFLPALIFHAKIDSIFLLLYGILSVESVISVIAWVQIRTMEKIRGNIRKTLEYRIRVLQRIFRYYIYLNVFLYILLVVLIEYNLYHPVYIYLHGFADIPFAFRFILYAAFIIFQWFSKRKSFDKHYGVYLNNLVRILDQTN